MSNKTIALPQDVYSALKKKKKKGETFADTIKRLIYHEESKKEALDDLAGVFKEDDEWDQILEDIYVDREKQGRID
jgi:predicted CopG family antitoxin